MLSSNWSKKNQRLNIYVKTILLTAFRVAERVFSSLPSMNPKIRKKKCRAFKATNFQGCVLHIRSPPKDSFPQPLIGREGLVTWLTSPPETFNLVFR